MHAVVNIVVDSVYYKPATSSVVLVVYEHIFCCNSAVSVVLLLTSVAEMSTSVAEMSTRETLFRLIAGMGKRKHVVPAFKREIVVRPMKV